MVILMYMCINEVGGVIQGLLTFSNTPPFTIGKHHFTPLFEV